MKKKTVKYLTKAELDAARGHFCLMADGSKGFICCKSVCYEKPTRILHNSKDNYSWFYTSLEMDEDDAPETIKHDFKNAYNIWHDEEAENVKVVEVLEKYDGRKYRKKKTEKESQKTVEYTEAKKDKKFLNASEIREGIGHYCKLADGQTAFIARGGNDTPTICMHSHVGTGIGWYLHDHDLAKSFRDYAADYEYGWYVHDDSDAMIIKVVCILDKPEEEKTSQSEKTILDMIVKKLLEKLNAFIKC